MEVKVKSGTDLSIVAALFALALVVRLAYLFEIESNPLFYDPTGDGRVYIEWAARIASGDILGDEVFYQAPLYPYFLGLLQILLGRDLWSIRLVQVILGAASCSLIFLAGKAFMGRAAGAAAGVILSLYAPAIFYDGLIQKAVLDLFLISIFLMLLGKCQGEPKFLGWLGVGVLLALLALSRENVLVWTAVVPVWIWLYFSHHSRRRRAQWVSCFFLGCALVLFPVGLRNLMVGGEFTLTTSQLGPNLYIGNHPNASGTYTPLRGGHGDAQFERHDATELAEQALGRSLSPAEVSRFWLGRTLNYVVSQPLDWLQLMGRKWLLVWNVAEIEDADDFYLHREWSAVLGILDRVMTFGLLAPLGAIGCVLTWKHRRKLWILYALLGTYALSVAVIFVLGRYRYSLVPMLVIFAGAAAAECVAFYHAPRLRLGLVCAAVGLAALLIVNWPVMGTPGPSAAGYNNLGNALMRQGRDDEAIRSYERALALDPSYAAIHFNLGNLLVARGDLDAAAAIIRRPLKQARTFLKPTGLWATLRPCGTILTGPSSCSAGAWPSVLLRSRRSSPWAPPWASGASWMKPSGICKRQLKSGRTTLRPTTIWVGSWRRWDGSPTPWRHSRPPLPSGRNTPTPTKASPSSIGKWMREKTASGTTRKPCES